MPAFLHILCQSIIGLRYIILLISIHIRIVAILTLIPVNLTGSLVKPLGISRRTLSPVGGGDAIALAAFSTFILELPATP
jgi:hypothetical protein